MIDITITVLLDNSDKDRLLQALECDRNDLEQTLKRLAEAATREYIDMITRLGIPSRADEVLARRLRYLIDYVFDAVPSEAQVASLFQIPVGRCKTVIRNALALYDHGREIRRVRTLLTILRTATQGDENGFEVAIRSDHALEEIKTIIEQIAPDLQPIRKRKDTNRRYIIPPDTFRKLQQWLANRLDDLESRRDNAPVSGAV